MVPIPPINELLLSMRRTSSMQWLSTATLGALSCGLIALDFKLIGDLDNLAHHQPIYVIPGAAEGVYAAGLTHYNVVNAARYLVGLGVNVTPATATRRFAELESYISAEALSAFRAERERRLREIKSQQQSRAFFPDEPDSLELNDNEYLYRTKGTWEIRSGSLPMSSTRHEFALRFQVGQADKENPYGIRVRAFEVKPLEGKPLVDGASPGTGDASE